MSSQTIEDDSQQILEDLISFIQKSIKQMISSKMIFQNSDHSVSPDLLSRKLIQTLKESLQTEREQYLQSLLVKLFQLTNDQNDLTNEYERVARLNKRDMYRMRSENEEMERQIQMLQSKLQSYETKKDTRFQKEFQEKRDQLEHLNSLIDTAQNTQFELQRQLSNIKMSMTRLQKGQTKMIREAKNMCLQQMEIVLQQMQDNQQTQEGPRISKLNRSIQKASTENLRLQRTCESLLESVYLLTPEGEPHPSITPKNIKDRVGELCAFIDRAVDVEKSRQETSLKSEVQKLIPDIEFAEFQSVSDSIDSYIQKKLASKDKYYKSILSKGAEEEQKLREKIKEAKLQIEKLQNVHQSDTFSFDEFETKADEWDEQKRLLDETLDEFKQGKASLQASFEDLQDDNSE